MAFDERKLRAVVAVAETGSLGRAAEAINLSQPALSRIIRDLELRLGTQLFERHTKGTLPTEAGMILIEHARQLVFDIDQAWHALLELKGLRVGQVRVGAVAAATRQLLPMAITDLQTQAPGLKVEVIEAPDSELADALAERRIDLIVASDAIRRDDIEPLEYCRYQDSFQVCCNKFDPPVDPDNTSLDEILKQRWVMLKKGRTPRETFESLVRQHGFACPELAIETNTIGLQISILRSCGVLGWLPLAVIADQLEAGQRRVAPPPIDLRSQQGATLRCRCARYGSTSAIQNIPPKEWTFFQ